MWIFAAVFSAVFAGFTAILSKCGIKNANPDVATAVRTSVVLVFAWIIVFVTGSYRTLAETDVKSLLFLLLSGLSTGASWICYFKALSLGEVSKVAAVDKSSVVFSVLFAIVFLGEREHWLLKLFCLALIAAGTYLMSGVKRGGERKNLRWLFYALLSALFAAATSSLAKLGIERVDSNAATAIRTSVVLAMAWLIVVCRKETHFVRELKGREAGFLVLSGIATGASWLCYFYAIQNGQVSIVVPIDKMSIVITVLFSFFVFGERISKRAAFGLFLMLAGTLAMAIWT